MNRLEIVLNRLKNNRQFFFFAVKISDDFKRLVTERFTIHTIPIRCLRCLYDAFKICRRLLTTFSNRLKSYKIFKHFKIRRRLVRLRPIPNDSKRLHTIYKRFIRLYLRFHTIPKNTAIFMRSLGNRRSVNAG